MKLSTRDKTLLVGVLVIALIGCAYFFGYDKLKKETEALDKEIVELDKKIEVKKAQAAKKEFYQIMKAIYNERFDEELKKFPADIQEENQIMFFKEVEAFLTTEENPVNIPTVSFTEGKTVVKFQETQKITGQLYEGISSTVSFPFTLTYDKFKALLTYLEEYEDRSAVSTVSASYNEEVGFVTGSVVFTQYAISEDTRILLQPEVEDMLLGTDNVFTSPENLVNPGEQWDAYLESQRIKASFDMFVLLEPQVSGNPTTTLGFSNSSALLRDTKNDQQLVTITVNEVPVPDYTKPILDEKGVHKQDENGNFLYENLVKEVVGDRGQITTEVVYEYRVDYVIGEGDSAVKIEKVLIQPAEYLDLYVYCTDREYKEQNEKKIEDKASIKATVINNTTKYEKLNIYVVENNYMTAEEKEALAKEEELRKEEGKPAREDLTVQRWVLDEEKSTMDKLNVITTTQVEDFLAQQEANAAK